VKLKLFGKLFLFLFSAMLLLLGSMILAVHFNFKQGLSEYLQKIEQEKLQQFTQQLGEYYSQHKNWEEFYDHHFLFAWLLSSALAKHPQPFSLQSPPDFEHHRPPPPRDFQEHHRPPHDHERPHSPKPLDSDMWVSIDRIFVFDNQNQKIAGSPEPIDFEKEQKMPIFSDGQQVAWLVIKPNPLITDQLLLDFMQSQLQGYLWIISLALLMSLFLAFVMTRQILSPLRRVTTGMRSLATGDFTMQIIDKGHDELATLAKDFNILSRALAQSEQARQQWLADISHELRTPLAILRGELEALVDGIRLPTPERILSLEQEVLSLARLVDDLYQLSLSDLGALDYQFNRVELIELCKMIVDAFQPRFANRNMTLLFSTDSPNAFVNGDSMRLAQLLTNLLENSYRYTNDNGECKITLFEQDTLILIHIDDSAPTVAIEELPLLFERFHRVDKSRQRQTGGAGLGLAICQNIVKAHDGKINATISQLGGVRITIELPKL